MGRPWFPWSPDLRAHLGVYLNHLGTFEKYPYLDVSIFGSVPGHFNVHSIGTAGVGGRGRFGRLFMAGETS